MALITILTWLIVGTVSYMQAQEEADEMLDATLAQKGGQGVGGVGVGVEGVLGEPGCRRPIVQTKYGTVGPRVKISF